MRRRPGPVTLHEGDLRVTMGKGPQLRRARAVACWDPLARSQAVDAGLPEREAAAKSLLETLLTKTDREDAIALVVVSRLSELGRESAYRIWCRVHGVAVTRTDLHRVKRASPIEAERSLLE
jgi:hypothetical protein